MNWYTPFPRMLKQFPLSRHGITFSTFMKTAWTLVLAKTQHSKTLSLVNSSLVETCAMIKLTVFWDVVLISHRWIVEPNSQTVFDIFRKVQGDYISAIAYESMSLGKFVENCPDWVRSTCFSSLVQHQNLDEIIESIHFCHTNCRIGASSSSTFKPIYLCSLYQRGRPISWSIFWRGMRSLFGRALPRMC